MAERLAQVALHAARVVEGRVPGPPVVLDVRLLVVVLGGSVPLAAPSRAPWNRSAWRARRHAPLALTIFPWTEWLHLAAFL